ncbi:unnamed protein product [Lactuca saligna]|uniref:Uncharacterized protein n=1 Tax=Lactuca saligna TaxID=75948 RepID=A0AA35Y3R3_LACSI|nr:unnamed protein product [Lactuca saligna]
MRDIVIVNILKMQTTTFVTSDPKNFLIVGSILQAILSRVPTDHHIIMEYLAILVSTGGGGSKEEIHEEKIPRKKVKRSKRNGKTLVSKKSKKHKRARCQLIIESDSSENTTSLDQNEKESALNNEVNSKNIKCNQYLFGSNSYSHCLFSFGDWSKIL